MAGDGSIEERLEQLERAVAELQRAVREGGTPPAAGKERAPASPVAAWSPGAASAPAGGRTTAPVRPPARWSRATGAAPRDWLALGQLWIGRVGIALLVLGLGFLYRYAVVRGWLTPELRIGFGLAVGAGLLLAGSRLQVAQSNRAYGLLLLGGGVGVLYLTAYAAFGFYRLVPATVALVGLTVLTLFTVRLAAGREESLLAHLGAAGAFLAPILVRTDHPSLALLSGYVVLVVAWTGWTALREGWRLLSWTSVAGGAVLLVLAQFSASSQPERALLVAAALLALPGSVGALLWRERAGEAAGPGWRRSSWSVRGYTAPQLDLLSTATLAVVAGLTFAIFVGSTYQWQLARVGSVVIGEAVLLGACAWSWRDREDLARALALAAAVPLLLGTLALELRAARGALALEALALLLVGVRAHARGLSGLAHLVFAGVLLVFTAFVLDSNGRAQSAWVLATDLAGIAAALYATTFQASAVAVRVYAVAGLLAFLAWLLVALLPVPGGEYWVSIAWGISGSALLLAGWLRSDLRLRVGALVALGAVALKLLFVDTATLPPGGRILVFLGFGVLFLVLGALYGRGALRSHTSGPAGPA